MADECKHGSLRRACPICLRDDEIKDLRAEIEQLREKVDKLPKTADGVRVIPLIDTYVFHPVFGDCIIIANHQARPWTTELMGNVVSVADCYSTREAAEAAKGE